jgi:phosphoglycolate phosphatase
LFADVLAYGARATQFRGGTKGDKLRHYIKENGLCGGEALIVGDSTEEITIARDQGLVSAAITGGCVSEERLRAEKPDYLIHSLHELKPILEQRGFAP